MSKGGSRERITRNFSPTLYLKPENMLLHFTLPAQALQIWMFRGDKGTCDK